MCVETASFLHFCCFIVVVSVEPMHSFVFLLLYLCTFSLDILHRTVLMSWKVCGDCIFFAPLLYCSCVVVVVVSVQPALHTLHTLYTSHTELF